MLRDKRILEKIRKLADKIFVNTNTSVYLYGSRARGDAHAGSDWDLLILTDNNISSYSAYEKYVFPFTEMGWLMGEQITPILYTRSEWNAERNTAFYINVQNEAILI